MASYWEVIGDAVASWALQDSTGSTAADGTGTYPSALLGGLSFGSNSTTGPRGWLASALQFDGVNDYVSIPSPATMTLGAEHSLSLWFRAESSQPWSDQSLVELGGEVHASVLVLEGSSLHFITAHSSSVGVATVALADDGAWHHVVAVHRSTSLEIYLDGVLVQTATLAQPWVADGGDEGALGAVDAGRWFTGSSNFAVSAHLDGSLAGVLVFRRALAAAEVTELRLGPEPTVSSSPDLPASVKAGDRLAIDSGTWDAQLNGSLETTTVLQSSDDGVTGWENLEFTRDESQVVVPLSVVGQSLRLVSTASNSGGDSEDAYSSAVVVTSARDPAAFEAGTVGSSGYEVGAVTSPACVIGTALPQQGGNE